MFSDLSVVEPDLLYISRERANILTDQHVRGAPDLVVEILSPGTRKTDEVTNRKLYERFDVQEYWVVDPEVNCIRDFYSGRLGQSRPRPGRRPGKPHRRREGARVGSAK